MPKLMIELDDETNMKLKELARIDERSLTRYIQRVLRMHAGTLAATADESATPVPTPIAASKSRNKKTVIDYEENGDDDIRWLD